MLKDLTIEEAQDIAYNIFELFDRLCRENNLTYFLSGGTLLGAARHKGFIPWDDDIDVMMPRADYDKLINMKLDMPEHIKLFAPETDEKYFYPFAKMCDMRYKVYFEHHIDERSIGMYIDIFPIDGLPDNRLMSKLYFKKIKMYDILKNAALRSAFLEGEKFIFIKKLILPYARKKGANYYARKMNSCGRKHAFGKSGYAGVTMITHYGERERMETDVFFSGEVLDFKDIKAGVPKGWDTYLTRLYGNYMEMPPEDKRWTNHSNFTIEVR